MNTDIFNLYVIFSIPLDDIKIDNLTNLEISLIERKEKKRTKAIKHNSLADQKQQQQNASHTYGCIANALGRNWQCK